MKSSLKTKLGRKALERIDLLLLTIESLDLNGSESIYWTSQRLGLEKRFPNRVELWKKRCLNPLRKSSRRGSLTNHDTEALILLICTISNNLYPLLRQLLSSREPENITSQRWSLLNRRFSELVNERMNTRRGSVTKLLQSEYLTKVNRQMILILALSSGPGGVDRLMASLQDQSI